MELSKLEGSDHRVFFQNAEGNINMGVLFNDPDVGFDDICWYDQLAGAMEESLSKKEGLVIVDEELKTLSCYAELHRTSFINSNFGMKIHAYSEFKISCVCSITVRDVSTELSINFFKVIQLVKMVEITLWLLLQ